MKEDLLLPYIDLAGLQGLLHSTITIDKLVDEEYRLDRFPIQTDENKSLESMSSGQQKRALLNYLIAQQPDYLVLDDVYSNVDKTTRADIGIRLVQQSATTSLIQLVYRKADLLPNTQLVLCVDDENCVTSAESLSEFNKRALPQPAHRFQLPQAYRETDCDADPLIELRNVSVQYYGKLVLEGIYWTIRKGEFWQLAGPNGSGKSSIISLITGDNPRGYSQDMTLFGRKKGSGETIWEIRRQIGYFTPNMITRFKRNDTVLNMIISGFNDSVGLYIEPTDLQIATAKQWLDMLGPAFRNKSFQELTVGQQRLAMVARAMVKHPPLLILDEPTIELDDENIGIFTDMVNAIRAEKQTSIIYVSHRDEPEIQPTCVFELVPTERGYTGVITQ